MPEQRKREIAYKLKIGDVLRGTPIIEISQNQEGAREKFKFLELEKKQIIRVNIIANIIDKFTSEGEKRWASLTIDDSSGQIKIKVFGDDIKLIEKVNQGDTLLVIGVLRSFNQEIYILPEIIKKTEPSYLLVRKLEIEKTSGKPKSTKPAENLEKSARETIIEIIKTSEENGGVNIEQLIVQLKELSPEVINKEVVHLLEEGIIYEPRPGRVRYLG